ncbi:MAG: hypothetical protein VYE04_05600 [Pseudomonadota bacterium]|nr:hypothetical protein [Pseudomonadota bacterium]
MDESDSKIANISGWFLMLGGFLTISGYGVYEFFTNTADIGFIELAVAAVYVGMLLLFVAALRQRLKQRKTDPYTDVEI